VRGDTYLRLELVADDLALEVLLVTVTDDALELLLALAVSTLTVLGRAALAALTGGLGVDQHGSHNVKPFKGVNNV
jgi:hypothetical protein